MTPIGGGKLAELAGRVGFAQRGPLPGRIPGCPGKTPSTTLERVPGTRASLLRKFRYFCIASAEILGRIGPTAVTYLEQHPDENGW